MNLHWLLRRDIPSFFTFFFFFCLTGTGLLLQRLHWQWVQLKCTDWLVFSPKPITCFEDQFIKMCPVSTLEKLVKAAEPIKSIFLNIPVGLCKSRKLLSRKLSFLRHSRLCWKWFCCCHFHMLLSWRSVLWKNKITFLGNIKLFKWKLHTDADVHMHACAHISTETSLLNQFS